MKCIKEVYESLSDIDFDNEEGLTAVDYSLRMKLINYARKNNCVVEFTYDYRTDEYKVVVTGKYNKKSEDIQLANGLSYDIFNKIVDKIEIINSDDSNMGSEEWYDDQTS